MSLGTHVNMGEHAHLAMRNNSFYVIIFKKKTYKQ